MPKDQFAHEKPLVDYLLDRLRIVPDVPPINPNLDGESGADVLSIIDGKRVGIQVTQIDNCYSLPSVPNATDRPIKGRCVEKGAAKQCLIYGGFAENNSAKVIANIAIAIRRNALHRGTGFDAATRCDLIKSSYDQAFMLPVMDVERAPFQWAKPSGRWFVDVSDHPGNSSPG
jgi:hypothetical protein